MLYSSSSTSSACNNATCDGSFRGGDGMPVKLGFSSEIVIVVVVEDYDYDVGNLIVLLTIA